MFEQDEELVEGDGEWVQDDEQQDTDPGGTSNKMKSISMPMMLQLLT